MHIFIFFQTSFYSNVTDSVTLSGDERDFGKVCVRLSYQEDLEQVWITLVQVRLHTKTRGRGGNKTLLCAFLQPSSMGLVSRDQVSVSCSLCSVHFDSSGQDKNGTTVQSDTQVVQSWPDCVLGTLECNTFSANALWLLQPGSQSGIQW